jgi:dephospho-CoA kinase
MVVIGLTGTFKSGKSSVAKFFKEKGTIVIDADKIVHQAYRPGSVCWHKIKEHFGRKILNRDTTINRKRLADIVFLQPKELKALCKIVHPLVIKEIKNKLKAIKKKTKNATVVIEAPLLFEVGLEKMTDFTVCVWLPRRLQIKRALDKNSLTKREIELRLKHQMSAKEKKLKADFIIDNSGTFAQTRRQVINILKEVKKRSQKL